MRIIVFASVVAGVALLGQTRISDDQLGRVARGEGVLVQTEHGLRTAMPSTGFAYLVNPGTGEGQAQFITSAERIWVLSEAPVRLTDGHYRLKWRPNPAVIAVYVDGLRLSPGAYRLIWSNPNQLPDLLEITDSTSASRVVVDYQVGVQQAM